MRGRGKMPLSSGNSRILDMDNELNFGLKKSNSNQQSGILGLKFHFSGVTRCEYFEYFLHWVVIR